MNIWTRLRALRENLPAFSWAPEARSTREPSTVDGWHPTASVAEVTPTRAASLTQLLGAGRVRHVLDFAAGNGAWARRVLSDRALGWVAPGATVTALELERPQAYTPDLRALDAATPGLTVVRMPNLGELRSVRSAHPIVDFREAVRGALPPGAVGYDLIHESFVDPNAAWIDGGQRLDWFVELLAPGGTLLLTHVHQNELNPGLQFATWAKDRGYAFQLFSAAEVPADYPRSFWFDHFFSQQPQAVYVMAVSPKRAGAPPVG